MFGAVPQSGPGTSLSSLNVVGPSYRQNNLSHFLLICLTFFWQELA